MAEPQFQEDLIDWTLTTWEGARREQLRCWAELPLENVIAALEEMENVAAQLAAKAHR
jgi:hypothetical protein